MLVTRHFAEQPASVSTLDFTFQRVVDQRKEGRKEGKKEKAIRQRQKFLLLSYILNIHRWLGIKYDALLSVMVLVQVIDCLES